MIQLFVLVGGVDNRLPCCGLYVSCESKRWQIYDHDKPNVTTPSHDRTLPRRKSLFAAVLGRKAAKGSRLRRSRGSLQYQ